MNKYIGIDVGSTGGIVVLNEDRSIFYKTDMPRIGKEYDKKTIREIFESKDVKHICLEHVWTTQMGGKASNFSFGKGAGILEGMLYCSNIPHTLIKPKTWQKEMWEGVPKQYKTGGKRKSIDTKATSLIAARRLFPYADFTKSERATKDHDGIVDSILIAEYCRRKFK